MDSISLFAAFGAGIAIFFSPCIFPLIPSYLSYLTGVSFQDMDKIEDEKRKKEIRRVTFFHALCFVMGFSVIFVLLGTAVSALGEFFFKYQTILANIGAVIIIIFGLFILGVLKITPLMKEKKIEYKKKKIGYFSSFIVGATFAFAWTPCVGPILGSILVYAGSTADMIKGVILLSVFSLGLGLPFILASVLLNSFLTFVDKAKKALKVINIVCGAGLILFGILILTGGLR